MKVLGVIVEYNPFHYGHLYHLEEAKRIVKPDYIIAMMSGNFVQRGEPAIINKFSRAEIALRLGVDIVFELPFVYSIQDAGGFAIGSVGILERSGVVTDIVFGSESNNIEVLDKISSILMEQPFLFRKYMRKRLKEGFSYPNARKYALIDYFRDTKELDEKDIKIIEKSNDILGLEYLNALKRYNSKITPHTIKRIGSEYKESSYRGKFSSATAIRKLIKSDDMEKVKESVPWESYEIILREIRQGRAPVFLEKMNEMLLADFRKKERKDFERIYGIKEGLDQRFYKYSRESVDIKDLAEKVKSKRFTFTRIRRSMLHIFFNLYREEMEEFNLNGPQYLRLLGFKIRAKELLKKIKEKSLYPIITNLSKLQSLREKIMKDIDKDRKQWKVKWEILEKQIDLEIKASNIYTLLYPNPYQRKAGMDFNKPIILE